MKHYLVFDGTSYFCTDQQEAEENEELEVIKTGYNLEVLQEEADEMNENAYN